MLASSIALLFAAATATTPPAALPDDPLDKVRCKREEVTGSLVSSKKICHTEREWRRISGDAQDEARRITKPGTLNDLNGQ